MRQLYLAATGMNRGKTTVSLGLLAALFGRGLKTGFIKPVGQRYAMVDGVPADEDAILMKTTYDLPDPLADISPVHIPRGFTKAFINGKVVEDLPARIRSAMGARGRRTRGAAGRGHRPCRRRLGHRSLQRRRGQDARRPRGHRQRGRGRSTDRRDRAQPRALHAPRGRGRRRRGQQGRPRCPSLVGQGPREGTGAARHRAARRTALPAAALESRRSRCSRSRCRASCSIQGRTCLWSSSTSPSAPCRPSTSWSGSGRAAC